MSTPLKPWESRNFNSNFSGGVEPMFGGTLGSQSGDIPSVAGIEGGAGPLVTPGPGPQVPPPLPPSLSTSSLQTTQPNPGYNSLGMSGYPYNSGYGGYGGYGGYSGYGGYPRRIGPGGYGMGYGYGGYQDNQDALMMQSIDESCTTLFRPFDALVRSISSIAMVLDSTHQAMVFSFRTVLSAADSLSKLKNMFLEIASSISIIRLIKALYYKILRLLGLITGRKIQEKEWAELFNKAGETASSGLNNSTTSSPWLALGFFSLMMGGPYLMFKMFAQNQSKNKCGLTVGIDGVDAIVSYDFTAGTPQELSVKRGDKLKISPTVNEGWVVATNGIETGLVPMNRLQSVRYGAARKYQNPQSRMNTPGNSQSFENYNQMSANTYRNNTNSYRMPGKAYSTPGNSNQISGNTSQFPGMSNQISGNNSETPVISSQISKNSNQTPVDSSQIPSKSDTPEASQPDQLMSAPSENLNVS